MIKLFRILTSRATYHCIFWLLYMSLILALNSGREGILINITNVLIHSAFLASLIYTNTYYLIPEYLSKKRFFRYLAWLTFLTVIATPLEVFCLYQNLRLYPQAQAELLQNQSAHGIFMFVVLSTTTIFSIAKEWLLQQRVQRDLERRNLQSELAFLKSQINPHFLFNTLNNLYALSLKKSDKAPELLLRLSEMMRYMLYECNHKTVPLEREIQYLQNYLELEKVRYGEKARIEFDYVVDDLEAYSIAPLLFIPLLENAFKHGLSHHLAGGFVEIALFAEGARLDFTIRNNKSQLKEDRYFKGGIGLKNIKRRLELLYPNHHDFTIEDAPDSYAVYLQIDLNQQNLSL